MMNEKMMDSIEPKSVQEGNYNCDVDVNLLTGIEMLKVDSSSLQSSSTRKLRKRIPKKVVDTETLNRRCSLRPRKRSYTEVESEDDLKDIYLDKSVKKLSNCLETIYEEPDDMNENAVRIGNKRLKRMIQFKAGPTDIKVKKRRARIKKYLGSQINYKKKKVNMQTVVDKLNGIRSNSVELDQIDVN